MNAPFSSGPISRPPISNTATTEPRPRIIGIGNAFRQDDGVVRHIAQALAALGHDAQVHAGDGAGLIDRFAEPGHIVLIDATRSGAAPGTLVCLDAATPLPARFFHHSTHRFGLAEAVQTAREPGLVPARLTVWGIEGARFDQGPGLSPAIAKAARTLIAHLSHDLAAAPSLHNHQLQTPSAQD